MNNDLNIHLPTMEDNSGEDSSINTSSPSLSLSSTISTSSSLAGSQGGDGAKDGTRDEGPTTPPKPKTSDKKRKRATTKDTEGKKQKRASKPTSPTSNTTKPQLSQKSKDDSDNESEADQQGKTSGKRGAAAWTQEELDLVRELCRQNKTSKQIFLELQSRLNSTKTQKLVEHCRSKVKMAQVEWSSEDIGHLLQAVKNFDKYKAIAAEFNRLAKRGESAGEVLGKGIIEFKLKSLEMEKKKSQKK